MGDSLEAILADATPEQREALKRLGRERCWLDGELAWKLDSTQRGIRESFYATSSGRFVLECARRMGKTFLLSVLAVECCLRKPGSRVVYGAQTIKEVAEFVIPTIETICDDAPTECRPVYTTQAGHFTFPSGSRIVLFGCDDKRKADRGRGPGADLVILDEAGFIPILRYVLRSVLRPQTLTTGGRTVLGSTPSDEPSHDFTAICEQAEANGTLAHRTIHDNPRLTPERVAEYIAEDAKDEGMTVEEYQQTDTFRREYLAQRVTDKTLTVVPEWQQHKVKLQVAVERPRWFDGYVSLDPGGVDPHGILFGYWHFPLSALVIEDELLLREGQNTSEIAELVKAKEAELWGPEKHLGTLRYLREAELAGMPEWLRDKGTTPPPAQPFLRVCDTNIQMARDLAILSNIAFVPTAKDEKGLAVNALRILMREGRVLISPRCRHLDRHLSSTVWANERRRDYRRKNGEHGDLVDALVYMVRNLRQQRNPMPEGFGLNPELLIRPKPAHQLKAALGFSRRR